MKFQEGEPAIIPWSEAESFAKSFGSLDKGVGGYEITFSDEIIADVIDVLGNPDKGVTGFTLSRPIDGPELKEFVFLALEKFDMLFFDQECDVGYAVKDISTDIPSSMLSGFDGSIKIIDSACDVWA
ncbi:hypothetical protein K6Y31_21810 [Motilimonas cestriensis]|uniref:Uncharacterized protein n=1 Tax=Motilimonas cestriensis TaxID=2742685 RepID=A0ABS8WID6_9GAMM|nr:hypothetical protein [Motilimonas cestriensis]MCE2597409.1 hypothetical protein [Motilimonas cestriensis]